MGEIMKEDKKEHIKEKVHVNKPVDPEKEYFNFLDNAGLSVFTKYLNIKLPKSTYVS